jgi:hypothetical protein
MRQQIQIAATMYRCHETATRHFGKDFHEKIEPYMNLIEGYAKEKGIDELKAVLALCEDEVVKQSGWTVLLLMAAAVELIEPNQSTDIK